MATSVEPVHYGGYPAPTPITVRLAMRASLRRLAKRLGLPVRAYFNPRFESLQSRLSEVEQHIASLTRESVDPIQVFSRQASERTVHMTATLETLTHSFEVFQESAAEMAAIIGRSLDNLTNQSDATLEAVRALAAATNQTPGLPKEGQDRAQRPTGSMSHRPYGDGLECINERIVEHAYALRAIASLTPGARVLVVGATESSLSLSLASIGFQVTAVDPRPYPHSHPNLTKVIGGVESIEYAELYDAILCLSTLQHIGVSLGESPRAGDADLDATRRMRELARPQALLVLAVPYGSQNALARDSRVYDDERLSLVLEGWRVENREVALCLGPTTWILEDPKAPGPDAAQRVAMVTARASCA